MSDNIYKVLKWHVYATNPSTLPGKQPLLGAEDIPGVAPLPKMQLMGDICPGNMKCLQSFPVHQTASFLSICLNCVQMVCGRSLLHPVSCSLQ